MIGQMHGDAVEAIGDCRAGGATSGEVCPEHEVVDEELRAATEKVRQRGASFLGLEAIPFIDWYPRQFLPLSCHLIAPMRQFLLSLE
jgi:hypothetical protein